MEQLPLFPVEHVVVFRVRPTGEIEARWPALDLCMVAREWSRILSRAVAATEILDEPVAFRVKT